MKNGMDLGILALGIYLCGGLGAFGGLVLVGLTGGRDLWGWGDGRTLGYLFLAVGIVLSLVGVLVMRIYRNRA